MDLVNEIITNEDGLHTRITQLLGSVQILLDPIVVAPSDEVALLIGVRDDLAFLQELVHDMTAKVNAKLGI